MPPARIREWLEKGPKASFYVMYGATEASARLTYLEPAELERKLGSIGRAIPNVEMLVVSNEGHVVPPGEVGELVARGSNISRGYWNSPDETAERFGPLGYSTGDLGYADAEGFLYLVGRKHDMIKVGAHRVGAKEIEDILNEHPAISEAAVVAVPHDILGEAPLAFIATRQDTTPDVSDILAFCRTRLSPHKIPVDFVCLAASPKSGIGKPDKISLRRMASERHGPAEEKAGSQRSSASNRRDPRGDRRGSSL
jgi:acyl-CoA synthetase (AMP-forming)/AMP-acid ligase II